jgi:hypothetical protein
MQIKDLKQVNKDVLLSLLGLESRPSTASWIASTFSLVGIGLLAGVGLGLVLATKPGRELRGSIRTRLCHEQDDSSRSQKNSTENGK